MSILPLTTSVKSTIDTNTTTDHAIALTIFIMQWVPPGNKPGRRNDVTKSSYKTGKNFIRSKAIRYKTLTTTSIAISDP